ncbi:MAG: hypothetical protein EP318_00715 [Rhodobacteraceae bacterium]|nr:MAG: hypothetical protein EP318_00715 [Paracoccaceae bacterium]
MSKTRTMLIGSALMAAIALGVPATSALAKGGDGFMGGRGGAAGLEFENFDQNGDGSLSPEELRDVATARFNAMDTDGDGEVSAAEMEAAADARRAARFTRMIERLDTDGNGTLSAAEMQAGHDKMRDGGRKGRDHARKDGGKRGMEKGEHRRGDRQGMKRGDGQRGDRQQQREARGGQMSDRMFALIDTDGNGAISKEEFDSARARLAATMGQRRAAPEAPDNN